MIQKREEKEERNKRKKLDVLYLQTGETIYLHRAEQSRAEQSMCD
jgi:hypothetical protein